MSGVPVLIGRTVIGRALICSLGRGAGFWLLAGAAWASAEEDIRDIRGPKAMLAAPWFVTAMLVSVLLAALYLAHALRGRRRAARGPVPTLSEHALGRLEDARRLMEPATAREFGVVVSEVIRNYVEKRFGVIATQRTTEEFLQALLQSSNEEALLRHRTLLAEFLARCDFVKFAGDSIAAADLEALLVSARGFVLETGGSAA